MRSSFKGKERYFCPFQVVMVYWRTLTWWFFKLFDAQIKPILTYGSEIWGLVQDQEEIERVHLSSIKRFLGLHPKAPRQVVYGESGRYPLYICTYIRCIKFWLHLASLDRSRYPSKAYKMLLSLQSKLYYMGLQC